MYDVEIRISRGQTMRELFEFNDENGDAVDISGWTFEYKVPSLNLTGTVYYNGAPPAGITIAANQILIQLDSSQTDQVEGEYHHDLRHTAGGITDVDFEGNLVISRGNK